jgi:hypothetical protein
MKKKRTGMDALSLSDAEPTPAKETKPDAPIEPPKPQLNQKTGKPLVSSYPKLTLYFPKAVHKQLRDIAYNEEVTKHDLLREALNMLFKSRGQRSIEELTGKEE